MWNRLRIIIRGIFPHLVWKLAWTYNTDEAVLVLTKYLPLHSTTITSAQRFLSQQKLANNVQFPLRGEEESKIVTIWVGATGPLIIRSTGETHTSQHQFILRFADHSLTSISHSLHINEI